MGFERRLVASTIVLIQVRAAWTFVSRLIARRSGREIGAFTADRWGDAQAERYLIGRFAGFQTLVDRPDLRRPFREIPPYLRALIGKHAAFYRVIPDGES